MACPFKANWTAATARSSTAVAVRVTSPVSVALSAGEKRETMGGPTSTRAPGWLASHAAIALFQYASPVAPVSNL